jgi:aryl-alcohol dehydrogenase-like predicted oxidoreductase
MAAGGGAAAVAIPTRPLGNTGRRAGILGIGAAPIGGKDVGQDLVDRIIGEAVDNGVNYIDTAPIYGASEERLGRALKTRRDKVFLVSKVEIPGKAAAAKQLDDSLRKLQTDHLDCAHVHNVGRDDRWPDLAAELTESGALGALLDARKAGKVLHLGCTAHLRPGRVLPAFATGHMELFMCTLNFVERHIYGFEEKVLPEARRRKIGVIAMKVLGGAVRGASARLTSPEDYRAAVRYSLGVPGVSVAIIGIGSVEELRRGIAAAREYTALAPDEATALEARGRLLAAQWGPLRGPVA